MHKFLKLSTVSMLAIVAASNANAAGYTCEELVEYTSCNPGYHLTGVCPEGSVYYEKACENSGGLHSIASEAACEAEESGGIYYENKCHILEDGFSVSRVDFTSFVCSQCPAGSICTGGTEDKTTCPAGSYCATAGLAEPTDLCAKGLYSYSGATACLSCPIFPETDKDGNTVVATTAGTGATSASECYISSDVYFKNSIGTWHFRSNCNAFDSVTATEAEKIARCTELGGEWSEDGAGGWFSSPICSGGNVSQFDQEECEINNFAWEDGSCVAYDPTCIDLETGKTQSWCN